MSNRLLFNKPSHQLVIDLINFQNRTNLQLADIVFGVPTAPSSSDAQGRNTQVVISGTASSPFQGTATVYYNRLSLPLLFKYGAVGVLDNFSTLEEALVLVNRDYGLAITLDELVPSTRNSDGTIRFKILESAVYLPGTELTIKPLSSLVAFEGWVDRLWYYANYTLKTHVTI